MKEEHSVQERKLLEAVGVGDERSFSDLYKLYYKRLYGFLMKMTNGQESVVRDILQESFLRVWLNRDRLQEISNFQAWIYKVVSTEMLTYLKKELHAKNKVERFHSHLPHDWEEVRLNNKLEVRDLRNVIASAICEMPKRRKLIYQMSRVEDLTPIEIASRLGISVNTVHNTITTALRQIRQRLQEAGYNVLLSVLFLLKFF